MKKMLKKLSKTLLVVMLLLAMDLSLVLNCVQAADLSKESLYDKGFYDKGLKYKGIIRACNVVVYEKDGKEYPAYCINPYIKGVGDVEGYDVILKGGITDVMLWRIITNGYPYKTVKELGVANKEEAYLATKQAVYSYLDNRDVEAYTATGEAGRRTLNALKQIWYSAQNSTETKISNIVDIIPISSEWEKDTLNGKYISKAYKIEAPAPITDFTVKIVGENIPKGIIVTNKNNQVRNTFGQNEEFKILIPTTSLETSGNFEINVKTQMETKPIIYGASENTQYQNYALTGFAYEDSEGIYYEKYQANEAKIKILKREKETKTPLEGVEFQLLNSDKNPIYQNLTTDKNGEIILKNVEPGTYYLKEVRTLPGYVLYDQDIKIEIDLNEQINVIVNNSKEREIEISNETTNIEVGKTEENIKEKVNETNIEKEINETNINKETSNTDIKQEINETNINKEANKINISKEINETNINKQANKINIDKEINRINIKEEINKTNFTKVVNEKEIQKLPKTGM